MKAERSTPKHLKNAQACLWLQTSFPQEMNMHSVTRKNMCITFHIKTWLMHMCISTTTLLAKCSPNMIQHSNSHLQGIWQIQFHTKINKICTRCEIQFGELYVLYYGAATSLYVNSDFYIHVTVHRIILILLESCLYDIPSLSVQWITPNDGQRNCLKHVEFHFQNKFEK
jgi:hypothetical protein